MRLARTSTGEVLSLDPRNALGAGGEARVMPVPGEAGLVAKVYRRPNETRAAKLDVMLANPPADPMAAHGHVSIAWPIDLLRTVDTEPRVVGFLMPRAPSERAIIDYYNPATRRDECPLFNYLYLYRTARNLAAAVRAIHARGYVIGDINESNIRVTDTALVTLIDTDSFQVRDWMKEVTYRCPVGKPEFTPPELQGEEFRETDRSEVQDRFGLAVLLFQTLMEGTHPFSGVYMDEGEPPPIEHRIKAGHFPYGTCQTLYRPMPVAPPIDLLPPGVRQLFTQCFEEGHRNPAVRPNAQVWADVLYEAESALVTCGVNDQHKYGLHLEACPWCDRARRLGGRDPFPSRWAVQHGEHLAPVQAPLPAPERPEPVGAVLVGSAATAGAPTATDSRPAQQQEPPDSAPQAAALDGATLRPTITTAPRPRSAPRPAIPWRWVAAGGMALVAALAVFGAAHARQNGISREITAARQLTREAQDTGARLHIAEAGSAEAKTLLEQERQEAMQAVSHATKAVSAGGGDAARQAREDADSSLRSAEADGDAAAAAGIVQDVSDAIERYKQQNLTDAQAERIRTDLRRRLQEAQTRCDRALQLDGMNRVAWVERVRALRLADETRNARVALDQALALFPEDPDLAHLRELLHGVR